MCTLHKNICFILCFILFSVLPSNVRCEQNPSPGIELVGEVVKKSELPDPATAAYPDCLTFLKFKIVKGEFETSEALVAMWGFKAYKLSEPGSFNVGDKVKLKLVPFSQVEKDLSEIMRVDDTEDYDSKIYWAKSWEIQDKKNIEVPKNKILPTVENKINDGKKVEKILKILKAHEGGNIGGPDSKMLFGSYSYLLEDNFWEKISKDNNIRPLSILDAIVQFNDYLKSKGIKLVTVFPPVAVAVYPEIAANVDYNFEKDGRVDTNFLKFKEVLEANGIFCADILPELMSKKWFKGPGDEIYPIYYQDDMHWNNIGAYLSGKGVANAIKGTEWFKDITARNPPMKVAFDEVLSVDYRKNGGYTSNHPEWNFPPSKSIVYKFIPDKSSSFINNCKDLNAPIWILGDSFSLYSEFPKMIAAGLGLPCNLIAYGGGSPTATREEFARLKDTSNIKIVIWEISSAFLKTSPAWKKVIYNQGESFSLIENVPTSQKINNHITVDSINIHSMSRKSIVLSQPIDVSGKAVPASVSWAKIRLGSKPLFNVATGLELAPSKDSDGAIFQILVNDEIVATQPLDKNTDPHLRYYWTNSWDVDLSKYAGQTIKFELRVDPRSSWNGEHVYWGNPTIYDGYM